MITSVKSASVHEESETRKAARAFGSARQGGQGRNRMTIAVFPDLCGTMWDTPDHLFTMPTRSAHK